MLKKFKKVLSLVVAAALVICSVNTTAFANETSDFSKIEAGTYSVSASLKCYTAAMGGVDFAEGAVSSAAVTVAEDGTAKLKLNIQPAEYTMKYGSGTAYISTSPAPQYQDVNGGWNNAEYTSAEYTNDDGEASAYVNSITFPVTVKEGTYQLAVNIEGTQFGGPNASTTSSDTSALEAVLSVAWPTLPEKTETPEVEEPETEEPETEVPETEEPETPEVEEPETEVPETPEVEEPETEVPETPEVEEPETEVPESGTGKYKNTLESGKFSVDISWTPMASFMSVVLEIDADEMTFNTYKTSEPETCKGKGTISFNKNTGVYTLKFDGSVNEGKTTFTYDADKNTITFTSALIFGSSSFNQTDDNGNFIPYTAVMIVEDADTNTDSDNNDSGNTNNNTNVNDNNNTDTSSKEDETEANAVEEETSKSGTVISVRSLSELEPGTYGLSASLSAYLSAMGGIDFGKPMLYSAVLIVDNSGNAKIKLTFNTNAKASIYGQETEVVANPSIGFTGYYANGQWVKASYTTNSAGYLSTMTFPISSVSSTYKLAMYIGGMSMGAQFGNGSQYGDAILSVNWNKVTIDGNGTAVGATSGAAKTGDTATMMPVVGLVVSMAVMYYVLRTAKKEEI